MRIAVTGAGGMIPGHLIARLIEDGHDVVGADVKPLSEWWQVHPDAENLDSFNLGDPRAALTLVDGCEWIYHLACPMGGIQWITEQLYDCARSSMVTTHVLDAAIAHGAERLFLSSSACAYDIGLQHDPDAPALSEDMGRQLNGEPGYGLSKGWEEKLCEYASHDTPLITRVARYHNIYGTDGSWRGGKEKAPAAVCRKVAETVLTGADHVEVWGDGKATRSYCWIDDCIDGTLRLMASDHAAPLNIGSEELISVDDLYRMVMEIAGVELELRHDLTAPQGVRGRNSDNSLCREVLGWSPSTSLVDGMGRLYEWVAAQVAEDAISGDPRCGFS